MELFEYIDLLDRPYDIFYTQSAISPMHWHYYSEILFMREGKIRLICNNETHVLSQGDLCYIYPLQIHEVQKVDENPVDYAVIKFDIHTLHTPKAYVNKLYDYFVHRTAEADTCLVLEQIADQKSGLPELIDSTVEENLKQDELFGFQIQVNICSLLINLARLLPAKTATAKGEHTQDNTSFYHILEYIDTHSSEPLEIQELAEKCHLSYSHFARLFRENYGRSCKEYINYIRLNKAEELLLHSNYDISYIAQETGFFDSSHFIRAYKKWKGVTPKQQRLLSS